MNKGKYLSDLYKSIDNKPFNVEEAIKFIVDKKRKNFDETIEMTTKWYFSFYNKISTLESSRKDITKYVEFAKERKISWIN